MKTKKSAVAGLTAGFIFVELLVMGVTGTAYPDPIMLILAECGIFASAFAVMRLGK